MATEISLASTPEDWRQIRALLAEYWAWLDQPPDFQPFDRELASLEAVHSPPHGCFLLARVAGDPAACGAFRRHDASRCEAKRLYVRPSFRGSGLGRTMLERLIEGATKRGCEVMLADTLPFMKAALALYEDLGFVRRGPYSDRPTPGAIFLSRRLGDRPD